VEVLKARQELARADNAVRINRVALIRYRGAWLSYTVEGEFLGIPPKFAD
jgi:cobalt-zinc-cadmium efflux system outer membrane protein